MAADRDVSQSALDALTKWPQWSLPSRLVHLLPARCCHTSRQSHHLRTFGTWILSIVDLLVTKIGSGAEAVPGSGSLRAVAAISVAWAYAANRAATADLI